MDGNGRTSRLLSTLCLYRAGYDFKRLFTLSEFYDRDRGAFYAALQSVRAQGMDLTGWLEYFAHGLTQQLEEVKEPREGGHPGRSPASRTHDLGAREAAVLAAITRRGRLALRDIEPLFPSVSRRTLQRDLKHLLDIGLVREVGSTAVTTRIAPMPRSSIEPPGSTGSRRDKM